jgi:hypothetical protein
MFIPDAATFNSRASALVPWSVPDCQQNVLARKSLVGISLKQQSPERGREGLMSQSIKSLRSWFLSG